MIKSSKFYKGAMFIFLVKKVQKIERFNFKYRKTILDLECLQSCKKEKFMPNWLQFKVANKQLESSEEYLN